MTQGCLSSRMRSEFTTVSLSSSAKADDPVSQSSGDAPRSLGVLDTPPARGMPQSAGYDAELLVIAMCAAKSSQSHLPAGQILHDLLASAANRIDLDVAIDALNLDPAHIPCAAKNLHCFGGTERHGLGRLIFQHAYLGYRTFALIEPPRQHFQHRLRRCDPLRHIHQFVADHLMLRQRFSKGMALLGVFYRFLEAHSRGRRAAGCHRQPLA